MKYRKKPVVIEAVKLDKEMKVVTLEGKMKGNIGDYLITGVKGEQYFCKPDIFEMTYEPASTESSDDKFIKHIQSHLVEGQEVICKICGESAKEIIKET